MLWKFAQYATRLTRIVWHSCRAERTASSSDLLAFVMFSFVVRSMARCVLGALLLKLPSAIVRSSLASIDRHPNCLAIDQTRKKSLYRVSKTIKVSS